MAFTLNTQAPEPNQCYITDTPEEVKIEVKKEPESNSTIISQYASPLGTNCVAYAKSKGHVPVGVSTLSQKISHVTSRKPEKGKFGITEEGPVGHFVYVEEVKKETIIISEGNFIHGYITFREISKEKIIGYL